MKRIRATILLVLGITILACSNEVVEKEAKTKGSTLKVETEIELADYMAKMQRYLEKAYWSAKENNQSLHSFYIHELEEAMESVQEAGITEDGVNISYNMLHYGIKSLEVYEERVEAEGLVNFSGHFKNLINGCNSCHMVSKKPFVVIQEPSVNIYSSQSFTP